MRHDRRAFLRDGALLVGFAWAPRGEALAQSRSGAGMPAELPTRATLDPLQLDAFLAVHRDGRVTVYSGKVDLGTGHRIAMRQMVGEELDVAVDRIDMVEGDTALTPDQGPTAGSTGVMRGGVQLRQAAATARRALLAIAGERLQLAPAQLSIDAGVVVAPDGRRLGIGELVGERAWDLKVDPKAPLKRPADYRVVGRSLPRPDVPAKLTGRHVYVHDHVVPGMLHGRVIRPPAVGATVAAIDEASVAGLPDVRVVRVRDFVGVVSSDEWAAVRAARELAVRWEGGGGLVGDAKLREWARRGPFVREQSLVERGDAAGAGGDPTRLSATYYWPVQSHASMGPSCAVADVRESHATIWTASQATHRYRPAFAQMLGMPPERVRLVYLDGAGCYGMNGHDDAAADAALLSRAVGRPVRVQWMREDELGWDPKGPPQLLDLRASLDAEGRIGAWQTDMYVPIATANLAWVPLLGPSAAGVRQPAGQSVGLVSQNGDPPYRARSVKVRAHWLGEAPLRPSNIRAPGKVANGFAVESFVDELAHAARIDPLAFRLRDLADPRGVEVLRRAAVSLGWQPRPAPSAAAPAGGPARGQGIAYVHYKHSETYVAVGMHVEVDRASGAIRVLRIACAHDCGLMINPDAVRAQVEGNLLQTLSRTLHEETRFDTQRVTSVDWASYPILRFPEVPEVRIDLVDRPDLPPLGAGEAASAVVAAALGNAVFDATGVRVREVPFAGERVREALRARLASASPTPNVA